MEIEERITNNEKRGLMILGDFNGHLNMIENNRRNDMNGKMVIEWMEEHNLILLNATEKCEGTYTRIEGDQKSAIDFILVNRNLYKMSTSLKIDEKKELFHLSDHTMLTLELEAKKAGKSTFKKEWISGEYYSKDESLIKKCAEETVRD